MSPSAIRLILTEAEKATLLAIAFNKPETGSAWYRRRDKLEELGLCWGHDLTALGWAVIAL